MSIAGVLKRVLVGRKLESGQLGETLLPKRIALPVFASDALSSVAYAPDEIFITLSLAGASAFVFSIPIGIVVALVMIVVLASYRQIVHAYPSGGGDYQVATANLGHSSGLVVASALLVDYVLTVAVSVSSGVQNAKAMMPIINGHEGVVAAASILIVMAINLRGVRESGTIFAFPAYAFMIGIAAMVLWGLTQIYLLGRPLLAETADLQLVPAPDYSVTTNGLMVLLLARTFSSGCAALTGVEAISNGVPAFKPPKSRNAATTLALLGFIAVSLLIGIVALSRKLGVQLIDLHGGSYFLDSTGAKIENDAPTVIGQLSRTVFFDSFRPGFYFMVTVTVIILFLAANTAFNGFPSLGSILAKDGYLPRQLHTRGDRLAFSHGIVLLAMGAVGLVLVFNASVTALIQLYVVGVFVSFTLSQAGMLKHWTRELTLETDPKLRKRMQHSRIINGIGLTMTGVVLVIVLISKFTRGAYLALIAMALMFIVMKLIRKHYDSFARELELTDGSERALPSRVRAIVLVGSINKPLAKAVQFAKATQPNTLEAITVAVDPDETEETLKRWDAEDFGVRLRIIASPYRQVTQPLFDYIKRVRSNNPRDVVAIYIPEFVVGHWWEQLLHNQTALFIKTRLRFMNGVMITAVPYHLKSSEKSIERIVSAELLSRARAKQRISAR